MNCRPNELAIVVAAKYDGDKVLLGKMRRVTKILGHNGDGEPCWEYEGARLFTGLGFELAALADSCLRPIRPEADPVTTDVVDEVSA